MEKRQSKIVMDLHQEVCAVINLYDLDNGIVELNMLYDQPEEYGTTLDKNAKKQIQKVLNHLQKVMDRIHLQLPYDEIGKILSGDRYGDEW